MLRQVYRYNLIALWAGVLRKIIRFFLIAHLAMYIQKRLVAWLACYYCRYIVYFRTLCFYLRPCVGHMLARHKLAQYSIAVVITVCEALYVLSCHAQT